MGQPFPWMREKPGHPPYFCNLTSDF